MVRMAGEGVFSFSARMQPSQSIHFLCTFLLLLLKRIPPNGYLLMELKLHTLLQHIVFLEVHLSVQVWDNNSL